MLTYSLALSSLLFRPTKQCQWNALKYNGKQAGILKNGQSKRHIRASYVNTKDFALLIYIRLTDSFIREVAFATYTYMLLRWKIFKVRGQNSNLFLHPLLSFGFYKWRKTVALRITPIVPTQWTVQYFHREIPVLSNREFIRIVLTQT